MARHVRKGDEVIVTAGKDKGRRGKVMRVITKEDRVIVDGINVRRKHVRPTKSNPQGGVTAVVQVRREAELDAAHAQLEERVDAVGAQVRVGVGGDRYEIAGRQPTGLRELTRHEQAGQRRAHEVGAGLGTALQNRKRARGWP